ncbi:MAG: class II aldolase/adducin family protein [bacterium]|nr:class II aldolase/adducin family protein [bacterium]
MSTTIPWPIFNSADDPLDQLVTLSRYYGSDPEFVKAGGGNTSVKVGGRMWIKATGAHLGTVGREGFLELDMAALAAVLATDFGSDMPACEQRFNEAVAAARLHPESGRTPSIETILHYLLPSRFVVHSHSTLINTVTCCARGEDLTAELFGDDVGWMPYADPGIARAQAMRQALAGYARRTGRAAPRALLMQNHGPIVCGETPDEVRANTERIVGAVERRLAAADDGEPFGPIRRLPPGEAVAQGAVVRNHLGAVLRTERMPAHLVFDGSARVMMLAGAVRGREFAALGPQTPQQIVLCQSSFPLWLEAPDAKTEAEWPNRLRESVRAHAAATGLAPRVFLIEGLGLFAAGDDVDDAETIRAFYADAIEILTGSKRLGGIQPMSREGRAFIETWLMTGSYRPAAPRHA